MAKIMLSVIQFSRFYFNVVINRHHSELAMKEDLARVAEEKIAQEAMHALATGSSGSAIEVPPWVELQMAIRSTIVTVENNSHC